MSRLPWTWMLVPLAMAAPGCGSSAVPAHGKVTRGAARYEVPADQSLNLTLYSTEPTHDGGQTIPAGKSYMAVFNAEDSTFTVPGPDGRGIPPGKYRVSLVQKLRREAVDRKNEKADRKKKLFDRDTDMLGDKFGGDSPFVLDVDGKTEMTLDLEKGARDADAIAAKRRAAGAASD